MKTLQEIIYGVPEGYIPVYYDGKPERRLYIKQKVRNTFIKFSDRFDQLQQYMDR